MTAQLTKPKYIKQRINNKVAIFLREHQTYSLQEILVVAATPAVFTDMEHSDFKELNAIMKLLKPFIKSRQRFLNYTEQAVKEGLEKEWIPDIDEEDIIWALSDLSVIDSIQEDGTVIRNEKVFDNFAKLSNIDPVRFGDQEYHSPIKQSRKTSREIIKNVLPDSHLESKLRPFIEWYKKWWSTITERESYKWRATKQFQGTFDINATPLWENLKTALKLEDNLLSGHMNFSKDMLLKNACLSQDEMRSALAMLFDESIDLAKRANNFILQFNNIHETNKNKQSEICKIKPTDTPHQNPHSISVYLAFAHASKHYIYKESIWFDFKYMTDLDYPPLTRFEHKLVGYEQICDQIREILIKDKELIELHQKTYKDDPSDYHLLTQDFIYSVAVYFQSFDMEPA